MANGRIEVRAVPVEGSIEVSISDTGVGIAPEEQEAVFEEFRQVGGTAAKKVEGTGLGLALSRKFIEPDWGPSQGTEREPYTSARCSSVRSPLASVTGVGPASSRTRRGPSGLRAFR